MTQDSTETEFAERVLALYQAALLGKSDTHSEDDLDVCRVAFGLAAITQAIEDRKAKYQHDQLRLVEAGLFQASDIMVALTSGFGHPAWSFIAGMRSGRYRPGRAPSVNISEHERFGGIALAYQQAAAVTERTAAKRVAEGIRWDDRQFTAEQIRTWLRRHRPVCERLAEEILAEASQLSALNPLHECVLMVGRTAIFHSGLSVPVAGR
ncbi:hypothetical protein MTR72_16475 [Bradyrhizobium sp. ISRA442]|uniref:hypothetical protein n=1 Tax=Bradyrhizobium sp. ISRA442 TaxID=2866197 RepID=UPI00311ADC47